MKYLKSFLLEQKLLFNKEKNGFENYKLISSKLTIVYKYFIPIIIGILIIQNIINIFYDNNYLFKNIIGNIVYIYIIYLVFTKMIQLQIVFMGDNKLLIMNTYSNKISYIPYSDIDDVEGAIFILKDIVKISLKNKVDGKSVINYLGTYRFLNCMKNIQV